MADTSGLIDESGDRPRVKWGAVATTLAGAAALGWFNGLVAYIQTTMSGASGAVGDLAQFVGGQYGLVASLFGIPLGAISGAFAGNIEFLARFGLAAWPLAILEVMALIWLLERGGKKVVAVVKGTWF